VNIVSVDWLKNYREAVEDYALKGFHKKVSFSLDWMICKIIDNLVNSKFDLATLKRIKYEWEEIVNKEINVRE